MMTSARVFVFVNYRIKFILSWCNLTCMHWNKVFDMCDCYVHILIGAWRHNRTETSIARCLSPRGLQFYNRFSQRQLQETASEVHFVGMSVTGCSWVPIRISITPVDRSYHTTSDCIYIASMFIGDFGRSVIACQASDNFTPCNWSSCFLRTQSIILRIRGDAFRQTGTRKAILCAIILAYYRVHNVNHSNSSYDKSHAAVEVLTTTTTTSWRLMYRKTHQNHQETPGIKCILCDTRILVGWNILLTKDP